LNSRDSSQEHEEDTVRDRQHGLPTPAAAATSSSSVTHAAGRYIAGSSPSFKTSPAPARHLVSKKGLGRGLAAPVSEGAIINFHSRFSICLDI
jgi:hypothetical protein